MSSPRPPKKTLYEQAIELEGARRQARRHWDAAECPPHEPLKALTPRELFARPRPEWRISKVLPDGALAELVGDSESLKSFIAIHMSLAIASGRVDFFNHKVKQGAVLYIAAEGTGAFQYRLRAWAHHHNVDIRELPFRTIAAPVNLRDATFQEELRQIVADVKPALIVVDTLHRCIPGAEENSSRDLGEVVGFATRIQSESGAAILFLHHPPKNDPSGRGRGSGALYYAADTELSSVIEGDENPDGTKVVTLSVKKQKDDAKVSLTLTNRIVDVRDEDGRPMADSSGVPIRSCILELASDSDLDAAKNGAIEKRDRQILDFVRANPHSNKAEIRAAVKGKTHTVSKAIDALQESGRLKWKPGQRGKAKCDLYYVPEASLLDARDEEL